MGTSVPRIDPGARQRLTARFGAGTDAWFDELPGRLSALAERWEFEFGEPIPRGSVSAVYWCRLADGRPAVLKSSPDRGRLAFEAAVLRGWDTVHSPRVIAVDEEVGALLIEAIEPGTALADIADYPDLREVAELMDALHRDDVPAGSFPKVAQRVDDLFDSSTKLFEWHPELAELLSRDDYERGRALGLRLAGDAAPAGAGGPVVLLHGDLTPVNILVGGPERGLVAVDPGPCLGDAAFDAVDLLFWRADGLDTIRTRAADLAAAAGLDAGRLLDWCRAFAGMCALEFATLPGTPRSRIDALLTLAAGA